MLIRYVAFYDLNPAESARNVSPAAVNKVKYISNSLSRLGHEVQIVSPTWKIRKENSNSKSSRGGGGSVIFPPDINYFGVCRKLINVLFVNVWLFFILCLKLKRREKILVYHSLSIIPALFLAKIFKSLEIALQVEELYTNVGNWHRVFKYIEVKYVALVASSYLLSTELLEDFVPAHKARICIYGAYLIGEIASSASLREGRSIRLLYAGIIDGDKKGAFNAVHAAEYLDGTYELHIAGFGEVDRLLVEVEKINAKGGCKVFYDGYMSGAEFDDYCSKFHVGLSTQSSTGEYLSSSFPSKVLTYLLFGMRVVSPKIDCLLRSKLNHLVNYYCPDDPVEIAKAIKSINFNDGFDCIEELKNLDKDFCERIGFVFGQ